MLKNYLKVAVRNLIKNKSNTFINIGGLTLGVVSALVIFLVIQYDLSFDTWHKDGDRVYRVVKSDSEYGDISYDRGGQYPLAKAVKEDISGVEYVSIADNNYGNDPVISYIENGLVQNKFKESNLIFVQQEFFNILTYQWLSGDSESALIMPNTAVVTKSFAEKMFGNIDVIGKNLVLSISGSHADLEIAGVVNDQPENSDFPFTILASSHTKNREGESNENDSWSSSSSSIQTYVKLEEGISADYVNAQFEDLIIKYKGEEDAKYLDFFLQPLSEIHFDSRFGNYNGRTIEIRILFALGIIGLFLLITACINFINLNTAIAVSRSKEVGLRKTLGGTKSQLTFHFLGETAFITLVSIVLGIGLTEVVLLKVEPLLGFTPEFSLFSNGEALLFLGVLFFVITLAAGWYPARHLSSFNPIEAIRNKINASYGKGITLRRSLIVVQFTITQILIIGTIVIATQINYFQQQDLGFKSDAIIEVPIPNRNKQTLETFKSQLLSQSTINNVTYSNTGTQGNSTWGGNYIVTFDTSRFENHAQVKFVDEDFVDTYGLTLLAGQNLVASDTVYQYLVNEAFAKQIGFGDNYAGLIGKSNLFWGDEAPIVGVVKDFNTQSLHDELTPVVMTTRRSYFLGGININTAQTSDALAAIEEAYSNAFPDFIFEYSFLDDSIAEMYEDEQRTARIMNAFTLIAILIGSLGLFGLVSYMATTRTKEIGVRKVLGANIFDILKIFGFELAFLIGISFIIAAPISWYLMQKWLADFAYKIELGAGIFILALSGTILIAVLTVGYRTITAALANPVDSLKSE
ncbi:MAG: FtsX-like permease family protein [Balneola sp.]